MRLIITFDPCSFLSFGLVDLLGLSCHIELKEHNVAVFNVVVFAFLEVKTFILDFLLAAQTLQIVELKHFSANKSAFEIRVDHACCAWRFSALADGPAFDLVFSCGEVVDKS